MIIAKMNGKIVQVERYARTVQFNPAEGWFLVNMEPGKHNSLNIKWVRSNTRFEWATEFNFERTQ